MRLRGQREGEVGVLPKTVHCPAGRGPGSGTGVPELRLEQLAAGRDEAAGVCHDGGVVAAQLAGARANVKVAGSNDVVLWSEEGGAGEGKGQVGDGAQGRHGGRHGVSKRGVLDAL